MKNIRFKFGDKIGIAIWWGLSSLIIKKSSDNIFDIVQKNTEESIILSMPDINNTI